MRTAIMYKIKETREKTFRKIIKFASKRTRKIQIEKV